MIRNETAHGFRWQGYEHHREFRATHRTVFSHATLPVHDNNWFVKLDYMCHQLNTCWPSEIQATYKNMFRLKFEKPYTRGYFKSIGVQGVGGHIQFEDIRENDLYPINNITYFPGFTLAPDCLWPEMNPAHFMFAFGILFEWGLNPPTYLPKFERLSLARCPTWSDFLHRWEWGMIALEASMAPLVEKGYFGPIAQKEALSPTITDLFPFPPPNNSSQPFPYVYSPSRYRDEKEGHSQLLCFETMYVEQKWSVFFEHSESAKLFRESIMKVMKKRLPNTNMVDAYRLVNRKYKYDATEVLGFNFPYKDLPVQTTALDDSGLSARCKNKDLRIFIQQRSPEFNRIFLNANEVWNTTLKHTNYSIKIEFDSPPMSEQIAFFNSFDILVATAGSHFTNLILTNRSNVAVLEVGLAIRDWFWRDNAHRLGIHKYFFSHSGHVPSNVCYEENKVDPKCKLLSTKDDIIMCPPPDELHWHPIGDCSFTVNITNYEKRLQEAIDSLCSPYLT